MGCGEAIEGVTIQLKSAKIFLEEEELRGFRFERKATNIQWIVRIRRGVSEGCDDSKRTSFVRIKCHLQGTLLVLYRMTPPLTRIIIITIIVFVKLSEVDVEEC